MALCTAAVDITVGVKVLLLSETLISEVFVLFCFVLIFALGFIGPTLLNKKGISWTLSFENFRHFFPVLTIKA